MKSVLLACALLCALTVASEAQAPKYGATATADKKTDFAALKTYVWTRGQPSLDKTIDGQITAAVDRELASLAFKKLAAGPSDVLVTYRSISRTDVDLKAKPDTKGISPERSVGTLVVDFLEPGSRRQLLRLRLDTPIDTEPSKLQEAIDAGVAALFAKYPTRQPR